MSTSAERPAATFISIIWRWTGLLYGAMTIVGIVGGGLIFGLIKDEPDMRYGQKHDAQVFVYFIQMGICFGCMLGIAQWIALRQLVLQALRQLTGRRDLPQPAKRMVRETAWWIVATMAGTVGGTFINGLLFIMILESGSSWPNDPLLVLLVIGIVFLIQGISIASVQWIFIRRRVQDDVGWIGWTGIASAIFPFGLLLLGMLLHEAFDAVHGVFYLVSYVLYGCLLGIFQVRGLWGLAPSWLEDMRARLQPPASDGSASAGKGA